MELSAQPRPTGPFEYIMMDFIELTACQGFKYCLVINDVYSRWPEAYACKHASACQVARHLVREIIPRFGLPKKISSDNGSHFVNKVIQEISHSLQIDLKTHTIYHPSSAGITERCNSSLKSKINKLIAETQLNWVQVLPIALMYLRGRPHRLTGLSPHEVLMGRPMRMTNMPLPDTKLTLMHCEDNMIKYCIALNKVLREFFPRLQAVFPDSKTGYLHDIQPGDWVVVRNFRKAKWSDRRWLGPYMVVLSTTTALLLAGRGSSWIHASHVRRVPPPEASPVRGPGPTSPSDDESDDPAGSREETSRSDDEQGGSTTEVLSHSDNTDQDGGGPATRTRSKSKNVPLEED